MILNHAKVSVQLNFLPSVRDHSVVQCRKNHVYSDPHIIFGHNIRHMQRVYQDVIKEHLNDFEQMVFLSGPRQVGKTTIARHIFEVYNGMYLNWDLVADREKILLPPQQLLKDLNIHVASTQKPLVIFDEIHKYAQWKNYLKGFYDLRTGTIKWLFWSQEVPD
jgi:predicted AAA+ superfamily ATPase